MELEDFDDAEIIEEIKRRNIEGKFETEVEVEVEKDLDDCDDYELLNEVRRRGYIVSANERFADLELTSLFADAIWDNMAEIIKKNGEQKLNDILELYLR